DPAFACATTASPTPIPGALACARFRPVLIEGGGWQPIAAELEGTFLLVLFLVRWRWVAAALRIARRRSLILLSAVFVAGFVVVCCPGAHPGGEVRPGGAGRPVPSLLLA